MLLSVTWQFNIVRVFRSMVKLVFPMVTAMAMAIPADGIIVCSGMRLRSAVESPAVLLGFEFSCCQSTVPAGSVLPL